MGVIDDVRKWLKEIPVWQELEKVPDRMTALETRMSALEERLKPRPGETCPKCGEHTVRLTRAGRVMGDAPNAWRRDAYACTNCDHTEERVVQFRR